jgi:hypothetical protein
MYLPETKYQKKVSDGSQVRTPEGFSYKGPYIELYDGSVYQGSSIDNLGTQLVNVASTKKFTVADLFKSKLIKPTSEDYTNGFYYRYFIQSSRPFRLVEVDEYIFTKSGDFTEVQRVRITWTLRGYKEDVVKNGKVFKGINTLNSEELSKVSKTFPKLRILLKNTTQYGEFL